MPALTVPLTGDELLAAVPERWSHSTSATHHRTPATAKTLLLDGELLASILQGVYTDVEKTMIELQPTAVVKHTRSAFHTATQQKFIGAIEQLSGREILRFISNHHVGPDIEIKLFVLDALPDPELNGT